MSDFLQNPQMLEGISALASGAQGVTGYVTGQANARNLRAEGKFAEQEAMREAVQLIGAQTVAYAAGGVEVDSGTPLDVMADTAHREALRAARARASFQNEANNQELAGLAEFTKGLGTGTDTLLSGYSRRKLAGVDTAAAMTAAGNALYRLPGTR